MEELSPDESKKHIRDLKKIILGLLEMYVKASDRRKNEFGK